MTPTLWQVEFHAHTRASSDGWMTPEGLVQRACRVGLDRVFVTDHNTLEGARAACARAPQVALMGLELRTTEGELLAYFVREPVPPGLPPMEALERLRAQGAFVALPHPLDPWRGRWRRETLERLAPLVDAIEVFNARTHSRRAQEAARELARRYDKLSLVGSDAHLPWELGRCRVLLPPFDDAASLREALREARFVIRESPKWVHLGTRWATWMHRLGLW